MNTASTKDEMFEYKVALNMPIPWPLKGQNPIPITQTVEKNPNMGVNYPRNTEKSSLMPKN